MRSARPSTNSHLARFLAALMGRMRRRMGDMRRRVEPVDVVEQEHPLPRHEDVVEEDDAIHLLEREPKGWSKCERPRSKLSRHRNLRPLIPQGIAKLIANGLWSSLCRARRGE